MRPGRWSHRQMLGDNDGKDDHQIVQRKSAGRVVIK